ncbi:hypothetical protein BZG30_17095 [Escherichia coli]|nr:hypothetical protein [Escherichia coli]
MPDATLCASYHAYGLRAKCRRIRRSRRIRQSCAMPDATLCASYQAYGLRAKCRPDKAFTPHPAVVHYYQRIFSLLAW